MQVPPQQFRFRFFALDSGEWHEVEIKGDTVCYSAGWVWKEIPSREHRRTPDDQAWSAFKKTLNQITIWTWKSDYSDPWVLDGGGWEIEIEWNGRTVRSGGENGYPGCDSPDYSKSPVFTGLLDAIKRMLDFEDAFEPLRWNG